MVSLDSKSLIKFTVHVPTDIDKTQNMKVKVLYIQIWKLYMFSSKDSKKCQKNPFAMWWFHRDPKYEYNWSNRA